MDGTAAMDSNNLNKVLTITIASFIQDRLVNREQRVQHKEQCAERLAAGGPGLGEVAYSEQAVLANLDWGIDALEEAISTSHEETKAARLQHAEKMLQVCAMLDARHTTAGVPNFYLCAWSHLNLAYLWKLRNDDRNAVAQILEMFLVDPLFSRIDFAPELWESLFLPHLRSIVGWYTEERHRIVLNHLPDSTDLSFPRDEHQCVFNETLQSGLSLEQTQRLQELEKVYQESLDENTKLYARYYKDWINFDPSVSKKGTKPLIPIAEPPMTPRHELSRLIPQSVKFGPAPPKSAGFYSVVGLSTGNAEAPTRYSSENSNTTDDEADGLSTRRPLNEVNWEEGRTKNYSTDNMYNGDFEMDYEMDTAKKAPAACHRTLENSKQVFSMHQTISEDKFMVANTNFPARQNSNSQTASLQLSNKKRDSKSKPLSELLEADTDTAFCSSPKNAYSSEDSVSTSPDAELYLEDANSYGNIRDDEDEGETESNDNRTHRAALEKKSYSMPISSPLAESEEDISQSSFHVHSSGKSTPQRRPPKDFVCPITGQLFRDPVTLETGQTYERQAIQEWLDRGNTTCPITRQTLGSTALPNTNILLKRLIGSWKEQNPELAMEFRFSETPRPHISNSCDLYSSGLSSWGLISSPTLNPHGDITEVKTKRSFICRSGPVSSSPTSVVSQATLEIMTSELRPSISHLCTSQDLQECESAVLKISKVLQDCKESPIIQSHLAKPAVINSFIEILSNSFDAQALKATVYILSELVSAEDIVAQTLMRVDPDFESLAALLRKGLVEAAVLLYQLKPSSSQLSFHGLVPSLVHIIITKIEENEIQLPLYFQPKEAAIVMLERMLSGGDESCRLLNALTVISMKALPALIESLECKSLQVRFCAVSILLCCIRGDGSCRNLIAHRAELAPVLELFHTGNDGERSISISFISELVRLNRRTFNNQALQIIKDEGTFSTMHMLLVYLQMAPLEQRLIVASLLLQLDLLAEPCKMSMYREEAIETLVEGLKAKEFLISQITAAETIVALSGRLSICGKSLTEAWLLRTAGFKKNYNALIKSEKPLSQEVESPEFMEEEEAAKDWERKVAFVLINYEFGALFEALGKCLRNNSLDLARPCLVAATWLTYMLKVLPDTGVQDVARRCLLQRFVMVLQSSRILEERILAMLALTSFINDSGALKDLGTYIKGIYKPLRLLKKSSTAAADILRALVNLPSVNVSKLYSFAESAIAHSRMNGEICSLVHCGGRIISGHSDGTLKVWDGRKRMLQLIQDVREHTRSITSISVSSSREKLYSGSLDKSVRVWAIGLQEIQCIQVLDMKDPVQALVVSSSVACFIAQGTGVKIHNWNGTLKLLNPNKNMKCLAMGDGKVYCGCTDYSLQEMDLTSGTTSTLHSGARTLLAQKPIYGLQLHDNHLYACGVFVDGVAAKVWNLSTNNVVGSLSTTADIRCIAVNSDFIFLGSKAGIIEVWLRERLVRVGSLNSEGGNNNRVVCLAVDKERDVVFSGYKDGKIQAWSLS